MTRTRTWLALAALLAAIVGGTVWAQHEKPAAVLPLDFGFPVSECQTTTGKKCCDEKCSTKDEAKPCCEGKCCTAEKEKAKGCCADGKCCGCCEKAKESRTISVPVPAGAAVQVTVEPAGTGPAYDMPFAAPPPACVTAPGPIGSDSLAHPTFGSAWCPAVPQLAPPPPPAQYTPVTQYVPTSCVVPPAPVAQNGSAWQMRVVTIGDQARLMMQWDGDKDTRVSCPEMVLHVGCEPLKVAASEKQVVVSGNLVKGRADVVSRNPDGSLLLEGHVKMHYGKEGKKVEVAADEVVVGITDGRVEVRGLGRAAHPEPLTAPKPIQPTSATPMSCPACPASDCDAWQALNFWLGFFH